jgi:hypothetical protein
VRCLKPAVEDRPPAGIGVARAGYLVSARSIRFRTTMKLVAALVACVACASSAAAQSINLGTYSGQVFAQLSGSSTFALQPGSTLPSGLNLVIDPDLPTFFPSTVHAGIIGIPTSVGTSTFSLLRDGVPQSYTIRISRLNIKDNWTLPDATRNRSYSYQLAALSPANTPAWTATASLPSGLTLSASGLLSGTPTVAGVFSIGIRLNDGVDNVFRTFTLNISPIAITPASLPNGLQGSTYGAVLTASGGAPPYTFTADSLPDGLTLTPTGSLTGTPTGSGHWWFNLTVRDAANAFTTRVMSLVIVGVPPQLPQIDPYEHEMHDCSLGAPCVQAVQIDGGRAPYTWSASGLPPGMDFRTGSGVTSWIAPDNLEIWGTPTALGDFNLQLTVTDADGQSVTNTFPFRVRALDLDYLENPVVGTPFTHHYRLWGGQPPYTMAIVEGRLPLGLSFDPATRTISGTPLEAADFHVVFDVTDAGGVQIRRYNFFTVATTSTVRILQTAEDDVLFAGEEIVYQLPACCASSYVWSVESGTLPPGLTISSTGLVTGTVTPGTVGRFTFVLRVRDGANPTQTSIRQLSFIVTPLDVTSNLPFGNVGVSYSGSVSATGAAGITWMLEPFRYLPPGLTLESNGAISGMPTASGRYMFSLRSTDSAGHFASWEFAIDIYPPGATPPAGFNSAPVSRPVVLAVEEGTTPKSGTLLATDPDGDAMTFSLVDPPDKGALVVDDPATGAFTYTPDGDAVGYDTFTFRATDPTGASSTGMGSVFIVAASPRWPGQTVRVNVANDGTQADGPSTLGAGTSADGRFVVFASAATTLAPNIPPGSINVYLRDRQTGQTSIVSVAGAGGPAIGGALPSISPDGRYVVFTSLSSGLPGGAPNGTDDVYLYDRQTGRTERVSVSSNGGAGNQESVFGAPSADGRYVVFDSSATNLVAGDTNGHEDVFLRDRRTAQTTRVSVTSTGAQGDNASWRPVMSADGRFIAFNSAASNLVANDTNNATDVLVRDVWTGQMTRVSVASDGTQSNGGSEVSGISADGRFVVFSSSASNLVSGDTNGVADMFVHDRQTGQTTRVSVSGTGIFGNGVQGNGDSTEGTISADGRYVVFRSWASNLVPNDFNGVVDEFVRDLRTGQLLRVNVASDGTQANASSIGDDDGCCITPTISADGRSVVVFSTASNLVPGDTNGIDDLFVIGPVQVFPSVLSLPGSGGSRSINLTFDYPGTPWTAATAAPWIALTQPASGSSNATVSFTVAPNPGPFRTATIVVALQTVTVTQQAGSATALVVADAGGSFGGTTTLSATLTNGGVAFPGQLVSFALNGSAAGTATTNTAGVATLSLVSLGGINAGTYPAGVLATYAGDDVHIASSGSATLSIGKVFPTVTWPMPAGIAVGTPLSGVQLNATVDVPGTLAYTPPVGTVLPVGGSEVLSVTFTPADTVNYLTVPAHVTIDVNTVSGPFSAAFHDAGDLAGGPFVSAIRDAARVGGVLYAVGASASHNQILCTGPNNPVGCVPQFNQDTAVLWAFNGVGRTLTPLPDLVTPTGTPVNWRFASAITRDGAYIASQARFNVADPAQVLAVRVTRNGLVNLNISAAPFPAINQPAAAQAISEDGSILYGFSGVPARAVRFDVNASSSRLIPLLSGSDTGNVIAGRGVSFDGSVMVGTSFTSTPFFSGTNGRAFRYVHASPVGTVSAIPLLAGGTWNKALAVSPDGRVVLVAGNSTFLPNGEVYLYDAVSGTTTALGSPNTPWAPMDSAGMTADGSVVAVTFADPTDTGVFRHGHGYIHNAHGWSHLTTILGEEGIDIGADGWDAEKIQIAGMSPDGTLVFGSGTRNDTIEGFVAEFSPGYLSAFDFPAVAPSNTSIVGAWNVPGEPDPIVLNADGTYFVIDPRHGSQAAGENTSGFERGRYRWDPARGEILVATLQDTDGDVGLSGANGSRFGATVSGDTLSVFGGAINLTRVDGGPASAVGGWLLGDPRVGDNSAVLVLLPDGKFAFADDGNSALDPFGHDGIESGTYTFNPNGTLTLSVTIDTDGEWGFSNGTGTVTVPFQLSAGGLHFGPAGAPNPLIRIVDPQAVVPVITSPLSASGRAGTPFSYTIAAAWAGSFTATSLPSGLTVNTATGAITGTPTVVGDFVVAISATNAFGSTTSASLTISVAPAPAATTLAATNASGMFGGTTTLSATLTSSGGALAGQAVSFSLNGLFVGTAISNASGVATLAGVSLSGINAATYPAGVQVSYAGDDAYTPSSATAALTVTKIVPNVTWAAPTSMTAGAPLSSIQLNATGTVPGVFVYTPPMGTVLPVGTGRTLTAAFTPTDSMNYTTAQAQVTIDVVPAGAATPAAFYPIGDLTGGPFLSAIRDATKVGGVFYAVGGSARNAQTLCAAPNNPPGCVAQYNADTPVLWAYDGTSATLTPLPDLVTPNTPGVNGISASAITRDSAYIAGQARNSATNSVQTGAVRVTSNGLVNLNLGAAPFPTLSGSSAAQALADDGSVLYGTNGNRAIRFDVRTSSSVFIPLLPGSDTGNTVAGRGASFDGSVAVGTSFVAPFNGTNGRAFRYVHGSPAGTVAAIPLLAGGTWNKALAVSPDGRLTLVGGNSSTYPNGEVYFYDAVTGATTPLGSPNTPWAPANVGGMTADGAVVAMTFADATGATSSRHAYIHNAHGWFHLTTALNEMGVDLAGGGWEAEGMQVNGVSPDGTLAFGAVRQNNSDNVQGFVAEFAAGALASFDYPAVPPADTAIVGAWTFDDDSSVIVFTADGTYFHTQLKPGSQSAGENISGFERGHYRWDAATGAFSFATLVDTNGDIGFSGGNGLGSFPLVVTSSDTFTAAGDFVGHRLTGPANSIVGGWIIGDPSIPDNLGVLILRPDGTFVFADDGDRSNPAGHDGIEAGTYTWTPDGTFSVNVTVDTDGDFGFTAGGGVGSSTLQLLDGGLRLGVPGGQHLLTRIVDPQMVVPVITSSLTASGRVGTPFSYSITANWGGSYGASGLPGWLSLNTATGLLSGTPNASGDFVVTISATNAFNSTTSASLTISVAPGLVATTLAAANASGPFGGTTALSATLASGGSPLAAQSVAFSLNGTPVGSATTDASGIATLAGASLSGINVGMYAGAVVATYAGDATYASTAASATLTVTKAIPVIVWPAPAGIVHGTPLSSVQLNATASVPGSFLYTPSAGTILPVGTGQTLATTFTPTDTAHYAGTAAQVNIAVVNAAAVAGTVAFATQEGTAKSGVLQASDYENDPLTFSIATPPAKGTLTLLDPVSGAFTFTPSAGAIGYDTFTFGVTDAGGASSTGTGMVFIVAASPRWPGQTIRASVSTAGAQSDGQSFGPSLSADGRYVAFASRSSTLVPGDTSALADVYVRDRQVGTTTRVSTASDGSPANGDSQWPTISADGRFVAFASSASNLVAGDTNGLMDLFVFDRQTGQTTRVSVSSSGSQANDVSFGPAAISADGRYTAYWSNASNLVPNDTNARGDVFVFDRTTGNTSRVSVASDGSQGNSDSFFPSISADGRYVAFESTASNFVAADTNNNSDVFVHDGNTGETRRISVSSTGVQADGFQPAISADGRFVTFVSDSALLTGRSDFVPEVLLRDGLTGQMTVISAASGGGRSNGGSAHPIISADGRFVTFLSSASNLVVGDTNSAIDIFVHDVAAQTTARVSVSNDGVQSNSGSGLLSPTISGDGRYVAFSSGASNLAASDTNAQEDIFVVGGVSVAPTTINVSGAGGSRSVNVSFDYPGTPWTATTTTPWITINPPTGGSGNGTVTFTVAANTTGTARTGTIVVALQTVTVTQSPSSAPVASNLSITTAEDTPVSGTLSAVDPEGDPITFSIVTPPGRGTVVITNATTGAFTYTPAANRFGGDSFTFQALAGGETSNLATVTINVTPVNDAPSAVDDTFETSEDTVLTGGLIAPDDGLGVVFSVASQPAHGTVTIPGGSVNPLGGSFTYVPAPNFNGTDSFTFHASDGSLTSNAATITIHVAPVEDPPVGADSFLLTPGGVARSGLLLASNVDGNALTYDFVPAPTKGTVTITDQRTGAFTYTPNANGFGYDAFTVRATAPSGAAATATIQALIVDAAPQWRGLTARANVSTAGAVANNTSSLSSISADGRYVAFYSLATNLVAGDTNGVADIFVRDRLSGQTTRVSVSTAGAQGNGDSSGQSLSADGRYVAFASSASNLVSGDTNGATDVFVHDRQTGQTTRVSVSSSGVQGNGSSVTPDISADGRYVVFQSLASNLVAGDTNGLGDVFVHDRLTGQTSRVSVSSGGAQGNNSSNTPSISADGRFVTFSSSASNLVAGDTNANTDVFVRDLQTGQTSRVSVASGGGQANDRSTGSHLSADGRYVAFLSFASNLVGGDTTNSSDIFIHDRQTGQTNRVDVASNGGQPSAGVSSWFSISADGRYVAFASYASNLIAGDTNGVGDIFVRDVVAGQTTRVSLFNGSQAFSASDAPAISADARFVAYESNGIYVASPVAVSPTTASFAAPGGSGSVTVSAPYSDIPWSAFTTAPWVTLTPPTGGNGSGSVTFTVSAASGAARAGTITVALQPVTLTQDGFVDATPPTVTPPAPITVYATSPAGATPNVLPALAAFISGATAVDDGPTAPLQQPPLLNGAIIGSTTVFPPGVDTVLFTFTDGQGHVGTAISTVTVLTGTPTVAVSLVGTIAATTGQGATLHVTNTGGGNALGLSVSLTSLRTLSGTGTVTLASGLPATIPLLSPGQSLDIPLVINVPATVTRFAISESLTMTAFTGAPLSTAATQTIFPVDVTAPTVLNNGPALVPARTSIALTWQTNEPATGAVAYGIGTATNNTVPDDGIYSTSHSVTITGLVPNTTYSVIVSGHDPARNTYVTIRKTIKTNP